MIKSIEDVAKEAKTYLSKKTSAWDNMDSKKRKKVIRKYVIYIILSVGSILLMVYKNYVFGFFNTLIEESINSIFKGLCYAAPRLIYSFAYIFLGLFVYYTFSLILNFLKFNSQKAKTVVILLKSIFGYVIFVFSMFCTLSTWGVDTAAIWASAGITSAIIALVAKTIITDLVAGAFIVLEGNIQVGDIVTFNGFKGTIREIGLRITKVENLNNDIQIIRNSEIKSIVNSLKNMTRVVTKFATPNSVPSSRVQELIKEIFEVAKKYNKDFRGDIVFLGVSDTGYNATYEFSYETYEWRALQTEFYMKVLIKKTFDEYGIY